MESLVHTVHELPFDSRAVAEAARLRALLQAQGQPIDPYDVLLAGQALSLSLRCVTGNIKEFSQVPSLTVENWQA